MLWRCSFFPATVAVVLFLSAVSVVVMPGRRSVAKRAERLARARDLGFLQERASGTRHVQVTEALYERAKATIRSLELHAQHVRCTGRPAHFAKQAAVAARGQIGEGDFKHAMSVHRARDRATHC